jgi:hypothetical protein
MSLARELEPPLPYANWTVERGVGRLDSDCVIDSSVLDILPPRVQVLLVADWFLAYEPSAITPGAPPQKAHDAITQLRQIAYLGERVELAEMFRVLGLPDTHSPYQGAYFGGVVNLIFAVYDTLQRDAYGRQQQLQSALSNLGRDVQGAAMQEARRPTQPIFWTSSRYRPARWPGPRTVRSVDMAIRAWRAWTYQTFLRACAPKALWPVTFVFDPEWHTSTATVLARRIVEERDFSIMPILADALQDAGCPDDWLIALRDEPDEYTSANWFLWNLCGLDQPDDVGQAIGHMAAVRRIDFKP